MKSNLKGTIMIDRNYPRNLAPRARAGGCFALLLLAGLLATSSMAQDFTVLHNLSAAANSTGFTPEAPLIAGPDSMLYGTTTDGGAGASGVVFKVQTDGAGFTILWSFSGDSDGATPEAGLLLSGNTLYGTAFSGGISNVGTIFAVNTDGSGFTNLYSFTGRDDGANPVAGLILAGNMLYGTASAGGSSGDGTVFALNTNSGVFSLLKTFSGANGANPEGTLVLSGSELFGTTYAGGTDGLGTIFEINTNGGGFDSLYSFKGGLDCGNPYAGLVLSGSELYGTTTGLSPSITDYGSIFKITTSGTGFTVLKTFLAGDGTGANPYGGLVVSGSELYGTTESGTPGYGTVFKLTTSGGSFTTLSTLPIGSGGYAPYGGLVLSGSTLYGTTTSGGIDGYGTVFEVNINGNGFIVLTSFSGYNGAVNSQAPLVASGNTLYGTTYGGGSSGDGTVFSVNTDGSGFTVLKAFSGANGSNPDAGLLLSSGVLFGTTSAGGADGDGTVFRINTNGGGFAMIHSFAGSSDDGANPYANLALGSDGNLYGTTVNGGSGSDGTVFQMTTNGTMIELVSLTGADGKSPKAGLTLGSDGNFYGTTYEGGQYNYGTVFRMSMTGTLATLLSFNNTNGAYPEASLTLGSDGNFYGTTAGGGNAGYGTIFQVTTNGALATLVSFGYTNGVSPLAALILGNDGYFYGTTSADGANGSGTVFQMTTNGTLATLVSFDYTDGNYPQAGLTLGSDGDFYGTTVEGGSGYGGTIFRLSPVEPFIISQPASQAVPEGANVVINASVFGAPPLFYQWTFNSTNLPGETNASLMLANVSLSEAGAYAFQVSNTLGVASSSNAVLTVVPAVATTLPAGNVSTSGAVLNGSVTLGSNGTSVWFEWGTDTNYGNVTATTLLPGSDESTNISAALSGLAGNVYYYRIAVSNDLGIVFGSDQVFTVGLAPTATTLSPNVSTNGTTLNAAVNPNGWDTKVYFVWGQTYPSTATPIMDIGAGTNPVDVSSSITGLAPATRYYYEVVASNYLGTRYGPEISFYGPPFVGVPVANWDSVASSADGSVLVAVSNPGGSYPATRGLIYISTNSGAEWSQATNAPNERWETVACSADGSRIIVGSGGGPYEGPIYTSPDTGVSWVLTGAPNPAGWQSVASSADGTNLVAAALSLDEIYASTNAGATWAPLTNAPKLAWYSIASSADGSKLAAVTSDNTNIYTSTNFGSTWITNKVPKGPEGAQSDWTTIASSADGSKLVAAGAGASGPGYIFISTNFGAAWTLTATNVLPSHGFSAWIYVASSADGSKLAAVSESDTPGGVITSTNSGATWMTNSVPALTWNSVALSADGASMVVSVGYPSYSGPIYTSQTTPSPVLNLAASGGNLMLSWLIPSMNFGLQQNSDLTTTNWTDMTSLPVLNLTNLQNQVVLPPPDGISFFRLKY